MVICVKCPLARFPGPEEECYGAGGLICRVDEANVGKYDACRFGWDEERVAEEAECLKED
ncbi:MAG: hypothetical protein GTN49_11415 [candidate division Zixibacteria bacterium]|nr:hypothetical protein [candidate division Zixibacteria bacterium]